MYEARAAEALPLAREMDIPFFIAMSLGALAAALADRDPARATSLQESAAMSLDRNYEIQNVMTHGVLVAGRLRDPRLVLQLAEPSVRHLHWSGDRSQLAGVLNVVAWAIADADPDVAATLQGAARTLALSAVPDSAAAGSDDRSSDSTSPVAMRSPSGYITELRRETAQRLAAVLGDEPFRGRRALGESMDADEAVAHALVHIDQAH